jgi:TetR/AcrR family transcriptional regulator, transcriptional repressor for nem operon
MERPARQRIMDAAHAAIVDRGAAGLPVDGICASAGVARSEFARHFADRTALLRSLLQLYLEREEWLLDSVFGRGHELSRDPLHGFLAGLSLLAREIAAAPRDNPIRLGAVCRAAVPASERRMAVLAQEGADRRRSRFRAAFGDIARNHAPRAEIGPEDFAELVATVIEASPASGMGEDALVRRIGVLRAIVRLVFERNEAGRSTPA